MGLSLAVARGGSSLVVVSGLPVAVLLSPQSQGSRARGSQYLWLGTALVAPRHVGSSQTRDRTSVPCIPRRTASPWSAREARFDVPNLGTVEVCKPVVVWNAPQFACCFLVDLCGLPGFAGRAAQR